MKFRLNPIAFPQATSNAKNPPHLIKKQFICQLNRACPLNCARHVPRRGAPSILRRPFSWEMERKIEVLDHSAALVNMHYTAGEATSLQLPPRLPLYDQPFGLPDPRRHIWLRVIYGMPQKKHTRAKKKNQA